MEAIQDDGTFDTALLYIDFSNQMLAFANGSTADQMAEAIVDSLANNTQQQERGYSFVYPLAQDFWDTTNYVTRKTGRFGGKSLYRVMCDNIRDAVVDRPAEDMPACALY